MFGQWLSEALGEFFLGLSVELTEEVLPQDGKGTPGVWWRYLLGLVLLLINVAIALLLALLVGFAAYHLFQPGSDKKVSGVILLVLVPTSLFWFYRLGKLVKVFCRVTALLFSKK